MSFEDIAFISKSKQTLIQQQNNYNLSLTYHNQFPQKIISNKQEILKKNLDQGFPHSLLSDVIEQGSDLNRFDRELPFISADWYSANTRGNKTNLLD